MTRRLVRQAGALGLLGADVPEEYGGGGLGVTDSLLVGEHFVGGGSLSVVVNCHTGIGSMPLVFFGNKAQKAKYLPGLASGEKIGAYALTEPGAGTDALSMQATAVLTPDGKYYKLNGTKQFITNGGFADIIFTYARVGGEKITAFVLERSFLGVSTERRLHAGSGHERPGRADVRRDGPIPRGCPLAGAWRRCVLPGDADAR